MHEAILLIIRRSWVRAPPAPPAILLGVSAEPWTDVGNPVCRQGHGQPRRTTSGAQVPLNNCHLPVVRSLVVGYLLGRCYRLMITDMLMQAQTLVLQVFRGMVGYGRQ
jgi:hypothetical protein